MPEKTAVWALAPPSLETYAIFYDSEVRYLYTYGSATEVVEIRYI